MGIGDKFDAAKAKVTGKIKGVAPVRAGLQDLGLWWESSTSLRAVDRVFGTVQKG